MSTIRKKKPNEELNLKRTFFINPPVKQIEPIYNALQGLLNTALTKPKYRNKILKLDPSISNGEYRLKLAQILKPEIKKLPIKNKTWYAYQVIEQIYRLHAGLKDDQPIWDLIQDYNGKIRSKEFREALEARGLYPTNGKLRNLKKCKDGPSFPEHVNFVMDYAISSANHNAFVNPDNPLDFVIQDADGDWFHYLIEVPPYVLTRAGFTGVLTKPRFWRDKTTGEWRGAITYGLTPIEAELESRGVMGIDLGRVNYFTGVIVNPDGSYGDPFVNSREIAQCQGKNDRRYASVKTLRRKNKLARRSGDGDSLVVVRREAEVKDTLLRSSNCKDSMARSAAVSIVSYAVGHGVRELHVESLSWLDSTGGSWDHARFQGYLREECEEYGLVLVVVNAAYSSTQNPVTGELGREVGRGVRFEDGLEVDRDVLAALNLASRSAACCKRNKRVQGRNVRPVRVARVRDKHTVTPRRLRPPCKRRGFPLITRVNHNSFNVEGRGVIVASLPVSLKSRYARVRDGWIMGSSEAWVTSRLVAFSNKRDASS